MNCKTSQNKESTEEFIGRINKKVKGFIKLRNTVFAHVIKIQFKENKSKDLRDYFFKVIHVCASTINIPLTANE